jgi:hypothetical protein
MAQVLNDADRHNQNYEPLTDDTLLREAAAYYDSWGTCNEQLRAHYLLGCYYRDLGAAPEALAEYHVAAECADTTQADCDYHTLSRVHGQMSQLFCDQLLPYEMLEELSLYGKYAAKEGDTLTVVNAYAHRADAYEILGVYDSVFTIRNNTYKAYLKAGDEAGAVMELCTLIPLLLDRGEIEYATVLLQHYKSIPELFDVDGNIKEMFNIYYYIVGRYYLATMQKDSAELVFRKLLHIANNTNEKEGAYQGLCSLYKQKHLADSVTKYAELSYHLCDSSYLEESAIRIQQMQSLYNYDLHRQTAIKNEAKANRNRLLLYISLLIATLIIGVIYHHFQLLLKKKKTEIEKRNIEHRHNIEKMRQAQQDLLTLQECHYADLMTEKDSAIQQLQEQIGMYSELQKHYVPNTVEERLRQSNSYLRLREKVEKPNSVELTNADWQKLRDAINEELPRFFGIMNSRKLLNQMEYNLCILIRLGFQPKEQLILLDLSPTYNITMLRKRLLKKIYGIEGTPKELDENIMAIV